MPRLAPGGRGLGEDTQKSEQQIFFYFVGQIYLPRTGERLQHLGKKVSMFATLEGMNR
jgi:hypothetical protein